MNMDVCLYGQVQHVMFDPSWGRKETVILVAETKLFVFVHCR